MLKNKLCSTILIIYLSLSACNAQKANKCDLLTALLSVPKINQDLKIKERAGKVIRLIDKSRFFKDCTCTYNTSVVGIVSEIPLDLNTGRCIDLVVLKKTAQKNIIILDIFYTLSGQNDNTPNLFKGSITFLLTSVGLEIKNVKINNIQ